MVNPFCASDCHANKLLRNSSVQTTMTRLLRSGRSELAMAAAPLAALGMMAASWSGAPAILAKSRPVSRAVSKDFRGSNAPLSHSCAELHSASATPLLAGAMLAVSKYVVSSKIGNWARKARGSNSLWSAANDMRTANACLVIRQ
jgi:hypothetical protein